MNKVQTLLNTQGFRISDVRKGYADFSLLSLRISIQSYAATANDIISLTSYLGTSYTVEQIDATHSTGYIGNCTQCIIHIQHFTELFVKNVLRTIHEALPCNVIDKPIILAKLLGNTALTKDEIKDLKTVELSEALTRLSAVLKEGLLEPKFDFIKDEIEWMKEVNVLRNRIMHRGVFVLRPQGLDELFGTYILPFIKKVFTIPDFLKDEHIWKYKDLSCGIDPISEIANMFVSGGGYDLKKAILLKQMILGGYENPLIEEVEGVINEPFEELFDKIPSNNELQTKRAEKNAANRKAEANVSEVDKCPVCGINSLVVYEENIEVQEEVYVDVDYHMTCECCKFSSSHPIKLALISPFLIREYW